MRVVWGVRSGSTLQIDTGASITCLDRQAVGSLNLLSPNLRLVTVRTPLTGMAPSRHKVYDVSLLLPSDEGNFHIANLSVVLGDFHGEAEAVHGVLGCDVLRHCLLSFRL